MKKNKFKVLLSIVSVIVMMMIMAACTSETKTDKEDEDSVVNKDMMRVVIGKGYDVTGRYAYSPEIKETIMDYSKLYADDKIIHDNNLEKSEFLTYSGNTITSYQDSLALSAKVGGGGGVEGVAYFAGEVGASFSKERYQYNEYAFATSVSKITKGAYYVEGKGTPANLSDYLTTTFKQDVDSLTAGAITGDDFIKKYGTHVMLGGIWGARADYHMSVQKSVYDTTTQIGAYAKAKAEVTYGVGSGSAETEVNVDTAFSKYFEASTLEIQTVAYGGSSEYARGIHDNGEYNAWIESIASNPVWCDYYPDTLIPVYELFADESVKTKIKEAYDSYLAGKVIKVTTNTEYQVFEIPFEAVGFTGKVGGDDGDIYTKSGRHTQWEYSFTLREDVSGTKMLADITLWVKEESSNHTEFRGTTTYPININKKIISVDIDSDLWNYGKKSICGSAADETTQEVFNENHGWNQRKTPDCKFLSDNGVYIRVDGSGDDGPNIGIKGTFKIPVYYKN